MGKLRNERPAITVMDASVAQPAPKRADAHYLTSEHQNWRRKVLARAKGRCQGVGCPSPRAAQRLFADHIVELQDGGAPFDPNNGQALCGSCHTKKTIDERAKRMARRT